MSRQFVSLMYHNVARRPPGGGWLGYAGVSPSVTSYFVTDGDFRRQADLLISDTRCMTLGEILTGRQDGNDAGPAVHVTFDDGWCGSFDAVERILAPRGWEATIFVTTDLIGQPGFVTAERLRSLPRDVVKIGSHAKTHRLLEELPTAEVRDELATSKWVLEDLVGAPIETLALPGGSGDERAFDIAAELGYRAVFTSRVGVNASGSDSGLLRVKRMAVRESTSMNQFARFIAGRVRREQSWAAALTLAKRLLGRGGYRRLRASLLGERDGERDMAFFTQTKRSTSENSVTADDASHMQETVEVAT